MKRYIRPMPQTDPARPEDAFHLAGGWTWFTHVEVLTRDDAPRIVPAGALSRDELQPLIRPRAPIAEIAWDKPRIMGILNTTPDSFSDGGRHFSLDRAIAGAQSMTAADIIDVGGESTRPGALPVPAEEETARTAPVILALIAAGVIQPVSIDTRKTPVAEAAMRAGATLVNDVSGFTFDPALAQFCARQGLPVCVMHAQGDPATMQKAPRYNDVLLDVYDYLEERICWLTAAGISRDQIIADPGIGFGKTLAHNLALLARLSLFHSLGVPVLMGASRKGFIGTLGGAPEPDARMPGSLGVALAALTHGTQIVRVHDVTETAQAIALWRAAMAGTQHE